MNRCITSFPRRTALVFGVANSRSIAWSCALSLLQRDYDVVVTYQSDRFQGKVEGMVAKQNDVLEANLRRVDQDLSYRCIPRLSCLPCDVCSEESVEQLFHALPLLLASSGGKTTSDTSGDDAQHRQLKENLTPHCRLDAIVHSIAYAPPEAMKSGSLLGTSREAFDISHRASSYSLVLIAQHALPLMSEQNRPAQEDGGANGVKTSSITALSYLGATRAVPNYNIMGPAKASLEAIVRGLALEIGPFPHRIRVNCVSSGPIATLAARGIRGFDAMRLDSERRSPLGNVTADEVAETVAFLAGDRGACGITGQTIFVDGGYSAVSGPADV